MGMYHAVEADYNIQYKHYGRSRATGSGTFGEVRACTNAKTHELRAIKTIEKVGWGTRGHVMNEIRLLKELSGKHPNIVEFVEYYEEWDVLNLIFEYCPKGTVEDALRDDAAGFSEAVSAPLFWQLASALGFLHDVSVLHRDVKPANLLFKDDRTLKLADFGSACRVRGRDELLEVAEGTPAFFAPEQHLLPKGKGYSFPVDVWAAGVTLYMMLFGGRHPFSDQGYVNKQLVRSGDFEVGWLTSARLSDLLAWLLMPHPDQRVPSGELVKHPWFEAHGCGVGGFALTRPRKLVLDNHGNWLRSRD